MEYTNVQTEVASERSRIVETIAARILGPDGFAVLASRPDTFAAMEASYRSLLHPEDPGGLTFAERAFFAYYVASLVPHAELAALYREDLATAEGSAGPSLAELSEPQLTPRLALMLRYVKASTLQPQKVTPAHVGKLLEAGLGKHEIVSLSQIVAFVSYQARVLYGLNLWKGTE